MRRLLLPFLLAACAWPGIADAAPPRAAAAAWLLPHPALEAGPRYAPGEVLVALEPQSPLRVAADGRPAATDLALGAVLARHGLDGAAELPGRRPGTAASGTRFVKLTSWRPDFDAAAAARDLRATGAVRAAVPNFRVSFDATLPNDPYLGLQWAIFHPDDSDIQLPEAWDLEHGSAATTIAIMDLGVDTGHPDLSSKIWINPGEVLNGLDDDGNGLVDDLQGWDFGDGDNDPNPHAVIDEIGLDEGFHGTFVAGIAAAATHNGVGIAGAGWGCKVMPLKIVDTNAETRLDAITAAFQYAADKRPDVLSMSFGAKPDTGVAEYFQALVDEAVSAGVVCVASAGNDSSDSLRYPAACVGVIAVGATDSTDARAWFSSYGVWVDVAAPGAGIWSTICRNYPFDLTAQLIYYLYFGWDGVNPYMYADGTSMACPLVAGVCGLLRAHAPGLTPQQVGQRLIDTGDPIAFDRPMGVKVNAWRALDGLTVAAESRPPAALRIDGVAPSPSAGPTALRFSLPRAADVTLAVFDLSGRRVRELVRGPLTAGTHVARWDGRDAAGRAVASGFYFARLEGAGETATGRILVLR
jgi:subtilisin family serine protease